MQQLQRDVGRVEAKVEIITDDLRTIKADLSSIKESLGSRKAVLDSDWKRLSAVALFASMVTHIVNWAKPYIGG